MKTMPVLAGLLAGLLPLSVSAAPTKTMHMAHAKKTAAAMYECSKCHMKVTAAVAKKDGYKDPMDGGKLVPVRPAAMSGSMPGMKM